MCKIRTKYQNDNQWRGIIFWVKKEAGRRGRIGPIAHRAAYFDVKDQVKGTIISKGRGE